MIKEDDISKKRLLDLIHDLQSQIDELKRKIAKMNKNTSNTDKGMSFGGEDFQDDHERSDYDQGFSFGS